MPAFSQHCVFEDAAAAKNDQFSNVRATLDFCRVYQAKATKNVFDSYNYISMTPQASPAPSANFHRPGPHTQLPLLQGLPEHLPSGQETTQKPQTNQHKRLKKQYKPQTNHNLK